MDPSELQQLKTTVVDLSGRFSADDITYRRDDGDRSLSRIGAVAAWATLGAIIGGAVAVVLEFLMSPSFLDGASSLGSICGGVVGLGLSLLPRPNRRILTILAISLVAIVMALNTVLLLVLLYRI